MRGGGEKKPIKILDFVTILNSLQEAGRQTANELLLLLLILLNHL